MKKLFFFLLFFNVCTSFSQPPRWVNYTNTLFVNAIIEKGTDLYIGGHFGLIRMDETSGAKTYYNSANSGMASNMINCMVMDDNGNLWMGSHSSGLMMFDGTNWYSYHYLSNGETFDEVDYITVDHIGNVYMSARYIDGNSSSYGLLKFNGSTITVIPTAIGTYQLSCDSSNMLWANVRFAGLGKYNGNSWTIYDSTNSPVRNIMNLSCSPHGKVWVVSAGLFSFDGNAWDTITGGLSPQAVAARSLYIDAAGKLYFYGNDQYVYIYDGTLWSSALLNPDYHSSNDYPNAFTVSQNGMLWSGYLWQPDSCLKSSDGSVHTVYDLKLNTPESIYYEQVETDDNGNLWISTDDRLYLFDGFTFQDITQPNMVGRYIQSIVKDSLGRMWMGAYQGFGLPEISMFDGTWHFFSTGTYCEDMAMDHSGNLYIASYDLLKFDGTQLVTIPNTVIGTPVNKVDVDIYNNVWVAGSSGFSKFDGNSWTHFSPLNFGSTMLSASNIAADPNGSVWVGLSDMLLNLDGSNATLYDTSNTHNPYVRSPIAMVADQADNIWFGSYGGLTKFNRSDSTFTTYDEFNSGLGSHHIRDLSVDQHGNVWIATIFGGLFCMNENGIDDMTNHTFNTISGKTFFDQNQNGIHDSLTEPGLASQVMALMPDSIYTTTNSTGNFTFHAGPGNYLVSLMPEPGWYITTDSLLYHVGVDSSDMCCYDFGYAGLTSYDQFSVSVAGSFLRCNTMVPYWLEVKNTGTQAQDILAYITLDTALDFISAIPSPSYFSGDSIFWQFNQVMPFDERSVIINLQVPPQQGDTIECNAGVLMASTYEQMDEINWTDIVLCSFDPNDKYVIPAGVESPHYTLMGDTLLYTIRFQNMGNDTAFTIVIRDTISPALDMNSFEVVCSSHAMSASYGASGAAEFRFSNVLLPQKDIDEAGSHGFVQYRIRAKQNLPDYTLVHNTAYIQFDFNAPVITNTTYNTMVYQIVSMQDIPKQTHIPLYPNPFHEAGVLDASSVKSSDFFFTIYDLMGREILKEEHLPGKIWIEGKSLGPGVYMYKISDKTGQIDSGKLIVY